MASHLLPPNATEFEKAASLSLDEIPRIAPAVASMRGVKLLNPPPTFLPYLIYEYGLGELTPYVPNLYDLIAKGIKWQRVRGTHEAVSTGLEWTGYDAEIEVFPTRRRRWHLFMLAMNRIWDAESPDLERIEGITQLSVPLRSVFWRGFYGYDIRGIDYAHTKWSNTRWSTYSGVRLRDGGTKWSFGRSFEVSHLMDETELTALGSWIAAAGTALTWGAYTWDDANAPWGTVGIHQRKNLIAIDLASRPIWIKLTNADGDLIGYRRARSVHVVSVDTTGEGPFRLGNTIYKADADGEYLWIEALTDFGNGNGDTATHWSLVWDGVASGMWAGSLTGAKAPQVETACDCEFGATTRDRFKALLSF